MHYGIYYKSRERKSLRKKLSPE